MVDEKKTNKKTEKKPVDKKELIKKFEDKNQLIEIDLEKQEVNINESVKFLKITELVNSVHRCRALVKRLGYKTSIKQGKYI